MIDNRTQELAPEINNFLADGSTPIPVPSATSSRPASRSSSSTWAQRAAIKGGASSLIGLHPAATNYRALLCGDPELACDRLKRRFETLRQRAERLLEEITSWDPSEWGIGFAI